jgi:hypothetical protein
MAVAWVAGNRGFVAGGATGVSTGSIAVAGTDLLLRALAYIGTGNTGGMADPVSVTWNGGAQTFTSFQAGVTFLTNFRGNPWHLKAPTAGTSTVTSSYGANSHDEVMLLADCFSGIDQTTTARTPPAAVQATTSTPSITVTSVAGDMVVASYGAGWSSSILTTISSSSLTVRQKVEGADIGNYEACAQGDVVASGTSTAAGFTQATSGGTPATLIYGVALIPSSGGGGTIESILTMPPMAPPMRGRR